MRRLWQGPDGDVKGPDSGAILVASCRNPPTFGTIRRSAIPPLTCDDARQRTPVIMAGSHS